MTALDFSTVLTAAGLDDATISTVLKVAASERLCACRCELCAAQRKSLVATREAREIIKPLRGAPVITVGGAWFWLQKLSVTDGGNLACASVSIHFTRSISDQGHLLQREGNLELTFLDGVWSIPTAGGYPMGSVPAPAAVMVGASRDLPRQWWAVCPECGVVDLSTWMTPERPGVVVNKQGVLGTTCDACGKFVLLQDWKLYQAADQAITPHFPELYSQLEEADL